MLEEIVSFIEHNGLILYSVGTILMSSFGIYSYIKMKEIKENAHNWPTVDGIIIRSDIDEDLSSSSSSSFAQNGVNSNFSSSGNFNPLVVYEYTVNMKKYTRSQIGVSQKNMSDDACQKIIDLYPVGSKVPVYYMPNNPKWALLDPNYDPGGKNIILVISLIFMGIGVSIMLFKIFG